MTSFSLKLSHCSQNTLDPSHPHLELGRPKRIKSSFLFPYNLAYRSSDFFLPGQELFWVIITTQTHLLSIVIYSTDKNFVPPLGKSYKPSCHINELDSHSKNLIFSFNASSLHRSALPFLRHFADQTNVLPFLLDLSPIIISTIGLPECIASFLLLSAFRELLFFIINLLFALSLFIHNRLIKARKTGRND
ncbi:hypothetical protein PGTUg99_002029 [Puccinia graminis f. sp. tritici]|uniref:Uncharacterized protein n=1 Tax=Puccinia graminis f. sp. tritici TaxID=56615 RepID=A0A5B0NP68_PUCGR|nr:hypothetical protein PGTUg99_002029 [Puccinia graminis f. sp. tritici]